MTKRVHGVTVRPGGENGNTPNAVGAPNPWERLAMRKVLPSVFAQDPHFARGKQITNSSEKASLDLGILSPKGEKGYLQRVAVRKNNLTIAKSEPGRIPNALRSTPQKG